MTRLFIAIPMPKEIKEIISKIQEKLRVSEKLKLVETENLHLTLKFLGEVPDDRIGDIASALTEVKFKKFSMQLNSLGVFPNENYIKIVWVGVLDKSNSKIIGLQKEIDEKLNEEFKIKKEKKFHSHITLARVKFISIEDKEKLKRLIKSKRGINFGNSFEVTSFSLIKSVLSNKRPFYTTLKEIINI